MKHVLALFTILFAVFSSMIAVPAFSGHAFPGRMNAEPLGVTTSGGGCDNCLKEPTPITCDLHCAMPLMASIENLSDSQMIVEVTLTISSFVGWDCGNASDTQTERYLVPPTGTVEADFSHSFLGSFTDASFSASAVVIESPTPELIGYKIQSILPVGTSWPLCLKAPRMNIGSR